MSKIKIISETKKPSVPKSKELSSVKERFQIKKPTMPLDKSYSPVGK